MRIKLDKGSCGITSITALVLHTNLSGIYSLLLIFHYQSDLSST